MKALSHYHLVFSNAVEKPDTILNLASKCMKLGFEIFFLEAYRVFSLSLVFQNFMVLVPCCSTILSLWWAFGKSLQYRNTAFQFLEIFWNYFFGNFLLSILFVLSFSFCSLCHSRNCYSNVRPTRLIFSLSLCSLLGYLLFSLSFYFFLLNW